MRTDLPKLQSSMLNNEDMTNKDTNPAEYNQYLIFFLRAVIDTY